MMATRDVACAIKLFATAFRTYGEVSKAADVEGCPVTSSGRSWQRLGPQDRRLLNKRITGRRAQKESHSVDNVHGASRQLAHSDNTGTSCGICRQAPSPSRKLAWLNSAPRQAAGGGEAVSRKAMTTTVISVPPFPVTDMELERGGEGEKEAR